MRFIDDDIRQELTLDADPGDPKTVWTIQRLTYRQTLDVEREAGRAPLRGLTLFTRAHDAADSAAAVAALDDDDRAAYDAALNWLADYNFAVCVRGVVKIDGRDVDEATCRRMLDRMRPTNVVRSVCSDLAAKIASAGDDDEKKAPSGSAVG